MNLLQYEIERRSLYIHQLTYYIKEYVKDCEICQIHKLNKFIKPGDTQIISHYPLERVLGDITYFNNKIELLEFKAKYLLCFTDHFSKFAKCYLINNKESESVLEKFKDYIVNVGKPRIFHSDNGGEFCSNIYKKYCKDNNIEIINGSPRHPRSQGAIEAFNKNITEKIRYIKLENNNKKFDINLALIQAVNVYNNIKFRRSLFPSK